MGKMSACALLLTGRAPFCASLCGMVRGGERACWGSVWQAAVPQPAFELFD